MTQDSTGICICDHRESEHDPATKKCLRHPHPDYEPCQCPGYTPIGTTFDDYQSERRQRFAVIFESHKAMAFAGRDDQFFIEHWTPYTAARPYHFDRYEINGDQITLYGIYSANCFINTISISFPARLVDDDAAITEFLRQQSERNKANRKQERAATGRHK